MELRFVERLGMPENVQPDGSGTIRWVRILQYRDVSLHDWVDVPLVKDTGTEPRPSSVE